MSGWKWAVYRLTVRTKAFWLRMIPACIGLMASTFILGVTGATILAPEQSLESYYGSASGAADAGKPVPAGSQPPTLAAEAGATMVTELVSFIELSAPASSDVLYLELPAVSIAAEGRISLTSGRWPTHAGEVAVTPAVAAAIGTVVEARVGRTQLSVVGMISRQYAREQPTILAAPGTWAAWPVRGQDAALANLTANRRVYFDSPRPAATCAALLASPGMAGDATSCETREGFRALMASASPVTMLVERGLPATGVAVIGALISAGLFSRFARRTLQPLSDLGLPRRSLGIIGSGLASTGGLAAAGTGLCLGFLASFAARPAIAARLDQPISPPTFPAVACIGGVLVVVLLVLLGLPLPSIRRSAPKAASPQIAGRLAGLGSLSIAAAIAVGWLFSSPTWAAIGTVMVCACLGTALWAPRAIAAVASVSRPPGRLLAATRALGANSRVYSAQVVMMASLVGIVCATLATVGGMLANLNRNSGTGIPPGMVVLNVSEDGRPDLPETIVGEFRGSMGLGDPVQVWRGVTEVPGQDQVEPWWSIVSTGDAKVIFPTLTERQVHVLEQRGRIRLRESTEAASPDELEVHWAMRGIQWLRVDRRAPAGTFAHSLVFVGLSPEQDRLADAWPEAHGIAPGYVNAAEVAPEVPISELTAISAALFAAMAAIMSAVAMRGEVAALHQLLAGLRALGLGRRWCTEVLVLLGLMLSGLGVVLGWVGGVVAALCVQHLLDGALLISGIPWLAFFGVGLGAVLGSTIAVAFSALRFASNDINGR